MQRLFFWRWFQKRCQAHVVTSFIELCQFLIHRSSQAFLWDFSRFFEGFNDFMSCGWSPHIPCNGVFRNILPLPFLHHDAVSCYPFTSSPVWCLLGVAGIKFRISSWVDEIQHWICCLYYFHFKLNVKKDDHIWVLQMIQTLLELGLLFCFVFFPSPDLKRVACLAGVCAETTPCGRVPSKDGRAIWMRALYSQPCQGVLRLSHVLCSVM